MENSSSFAHIVQAVARLPRKRMAVVCPDDSHTQAALLQVLQHNLADLLLVGQSKNTQGLPAFAPFESHLQRIEAADCDEAARKAVALVRGGEADVLMKGLINTDRFLKAVLNKEAGILSPGHVLTHITVAQVPHRSRLLFFSDAAVLPAPTLEQRAAQVNYMADACRKLGIAKPVISLIHCSEQVSDKFPVTLDYQRIKQWASEGRFGEVVVDGPLDVRTSCDKESAELKGITSPVCGCADALIFPEIESGNAFYKTITFFAGAETAGVLQGAACPVVLASRGDSVTSKLNSIALAIAVSRR